MLLLRLCYYLYLWRSKTSISTHYSLKPETAPACCSMYISLIIFLLRNFIANKIIKSCNGVKRVKMLTNLCLHSLSAWCITLCTIFCFKRCYEKLQEIICLYKKRWRLKKRIDGTFVSLTLSIA